MDIGATVIVTTKEDMKDLLQTMIKEVVKDTKEKSVLIQKPIIDFIREDQLLELLGLKDAQNLREKLDQCNVPVSKAFKKRMYSIAGINAFLENSSTFSYVFVILEAAS